MVERGPAGSGGAAALGEVDLRPHPAHGRADHGLGSVPFAALDGRRMGVLLVDQ